MSIDGMARGACRPAQRCSRSRRERSDVFLDERPDRLDGINPTPHLM